MKSWRIPKLLLFLLAAQVCFAQPPSGGDPAPQAKPAGPDVAGGAAPAFSSTPQQGKAWRNSLGMEFLPVPGLSVLFGRCEVSNAQFRKFRPAFAQRGKVSADLIGDTQPAILVQWDDARAFCEWLTARERESRAIGTNQAYRLPRDWEWSVAVGLKEPLDGTPASKDQKITGVFPWGTDWPPPSGAGNYADISAWTIGKKYEWNIIEVFNDGHWPPAPIGSYPPNRFGVCDLGGNALEWCEDLYDEKGLERVLRGGAYSRCLPEQLWSSYRYLYAPTVRDPSVGFRCVLDLLPPRQEPAGERSPAAGASR